MKIRNLKYRDKRALFFRKIEKMTDLIKDIEALDKTIRGVNKRYIPKEIEELFLGVFPFPKNRKKRVEKIIKAAEIAVKKEKLSIEK